MDPLFPFDPKRSLAPLVEDLGSALLVPFDDGRPGRRPKLGGVLRADGSFVDASNLYISETRHLNRPPHPASYADVSERSGTWLFGGKHDGRFGHFLVETLARLWALEQSDRPVDGVVFVPKKVLPDARAQKQFNATRGLFALFPSLPPIEVLSTPTRFERLVVPPQGCGAGSMAPGCPEFRAFIRRQFAPHVAPAASGKLYVSRTKMRKTPGHVLFEDRIEALARADGYEVFHPQDHSAEIQIARYRGASHILGVEGSAFHMIALANPEHANIGMIRRRLGDAPLGFVAQVSLMTGRDCTDFSAVSENFILEGGHAMANAVLDFDVLLDGLAASGFLSNRPAVPAPTNAAVAAAKEQFAREVLGPEG